MARLLTEDIELRELIGTGGFGEVFRAHQRSLDRNVAVKLLRAELASKESVLRRFDREAVTLARIRHPHIVSIHGVGQTDDGRHYLLMELLEGCSLLEIMGDGPLETERALNIGAQLADALAGAHRAGVIHGDLSPRNVHVRSDVGTVRDFVTVLDFGMARLLDGQAPQADSTGAGTAAYMSPERVLGEPLTTASDQYSLGLLLYELFTGQRPYAAETSPLGVLMQHVNDPATPVSAVTRGVPASVAACIDRLLSKDPEVRPSATFVRDLLLDPENAPVLRPIRRRRRVVMVISTGVLAIGLAWGVAWNQEPSTTEEVPAARTPLRVPDAAESLPRRGRSIIPRQAVDVQRRPRRSQDPDAAYVTVRSTPRGAWVYEHGRRVGRTPFELDVGSGPRQVVLRLGEYKPRTKTVSAGRDVHVDMRWPGQ